jgi:hypothetical protein
MKSITYRRNGATLSIPVGFSWTTFVFGLWPSVFRSHWRLVWTFLAADTAAWWITEFAFQGRDFLLTFILVRGICAYYRNEELNKAVKRDGWRTEAELFVVDSK